MAEAGAVISSLRGGGIKVAPLRKFDHKASVNQMQMPLCWLLRFFFFFFFWSREERKRATALPQHLSDTD